MSKPRFLHKLLSRRILFGVSLGAALFFGLIGVMAWGGFNWAMEETNTEAFCISCHEMRDNVYQEYKKTVHYSNRSGVRATCPDCHVPKEWTYKIKRKIQASNELWHKMLGTIDTKEKFEAKRLELAKNEWARMKATDSRECRNCHTLESMNQLAQQPRSQKQHLYALQQGQTCIDCHKGIAHKNVRHMLSDAELEELEKPDPSLAKPDATLHVFEHELKAKKEREAREAAEAKRLAEARAMRLTEMSGSDGDAAPDWGVDWANVPGRETTLFFPGQASIEWILGRDHGGKNAFKHGERCVDCHDQETADLGKKIVSGGNEELEPNPIPGKRGSIPVYIQASHDQDYLYMRLSWPESEHTPVPFVEGGKMDPDNPMKLALMLTNDDVEYADRGGCWGTCHHDARTMPDTPDAETLASSDAVKSLDTADGITKYLKESRSRIEIRGRRGRPRGGWDKLNSEEEIQSAMADYRFVDLIRYKAGSEQVEDGHIMAERVMDGGQGSEFHATLVDGNWVVEMKRKLKSDKPGDINLALDKLYNVGFAIHDDFSDSRYHHVSLGYRLGFDNPDAEINAVAK